MRPALPFWRVPERKHLVSTRDEQALTMPYS